MSPFWLRKSTTLNTDCDTGHSLCVNSEGSITEDAILHDNLVDAQFELSRVSASASATDAPATTKLRLQLTACAHETTKKESVTKHWAVRFMAAKMFQIWLKGGKVATQDVSLKFKGE